MSKLFRLPTILLGVLLLQAPFCRLGDSLGEVGVAQTGVIIFREWVFLRVGSGLNQKTPFVWRGGLEELQYPQGSASPPEVLPVGLVL